MRIIAKAQVCLPQWANFRGLIIKLIPWRMRAHRLFTIVRAQVAIVPFDHADVAVAEIVGHHQHRHAAHDG
jgi:hypothetical protein